VHPEVEVLFISGYTDDETIRRGVRDGSKAFLHKPFAREELLGTIRLLLDRA
jgi:DNA-binding response OmpR family regulator